MHGAVMLDASDRVVRPALIWCDVRTDRQCRELTEKIGAERLIQLTCNPALANFTLTKFLWVRENEPEQWKRVRSVMLPKDYVRFRLTGDRAIDMADASDAHVGCGEPAWSKEMLAATQIDQELLQRCTGRRRFAGKYRRENGSNRVEAEHLLWRARAIRQRGRRAWASCARSSQCHDRNFGRCRRGHRSSGA
jgi:xylulokinase